MFHKKKKSSDYVKNKSVLTKYGTEYGPKTTQNSTGAVIFFSKYKEAWVPVTQNIEVFLGVNLPSSSSRRGGMERGW